MPGYPILASCRTVGFPAKEEELTSPGSASGPQHVWASRDGGRLFVADIARLRLRAGWQQRPTGSGLAAWPSCQRLRTRRGLAARASPGRARSHPRLVGRAARGACALRCTGGRDALPGPPPPDASRWLAGPGSTIGQPRSRWRAWCWRAARGAQGWLCRGGILPVSCRDEGLGFNHKLAGSPCTEISSRRWVECPWAWCAP